MRILEVNRYFQDDHQGFIWPPHNAVPGGDRGVEQDFHEWFLRTPMIRRSDWAYFPLYWNRWHLNHPDEDGHWGGTQQDRERLQAEIDRCYPGGRWFTIAEADIRMIQPYLDLHDMVVFTASRRAEGTGIDIPLLSAEHPIPEQWYVKRWLASFLGHMQTDGIRIQMGEALAGREDCRIEHANHGPTEFVQTMLESYIALCPRGQGGQSFRFYEAMQIGIVPLYLSDMDCRPFKDWIDWASCSLYVEDVSTLSWFLDTLDPGLLLEMGQNAKRVYREQLAYGRWCPYVLAELERL